MPIAYGFAEYGGPQVQRRLEVPIPRPGDGEVLVAVHAAGVNPVDWKIRAGQLRGVLPLEMPAVLGREVAGRVARVGPGVGQFRVGADVFGCTISGYGGYAEYTLAKAAQLAPKPPSVSFTDAAALPVAAATAYTVLHDLELATEQPLLILGIGGGVGIAATQLAQLSGLHVLGTASAGKCALVERLGATCVAYDHPGATALLRQELPHGPAAVLDLAGGGALDAVAPIIGAHCRVLSVENEANRARYAAGPVRRDTSGTVLIELAQLAATGRFDPHVRRHFPLHAAGDALELVERGHAAGKVVLRVVEDPSIAGP